MEPTPLAGPLKVFFIAGSSFSHGDQAGQRLKSLINAAIFSGGALIVILRLTLKLSGLVVAYSSTPAIRIAITKRIFFSISPPIWTRSTLRQAQGERCYIAFMLSLLKHSSQA